jgi:predicted O-methyltransferase YrrM
LSFLASLRALPPRVAWFYWRAERTARKAGDQWSLDSVVRPRELADLVELASGREHVVELGTGTAWTAIALALGDRRRRVTTYDPIVRPQRGLYLELLGKDARTRLELVGTSGREGANDAAAVEMVFIDSSHERTETIAEFEAWRARLQPNGIVVFHDYHHPDYPGVAEATAALGLEGEVRGGLFVWRAGQSGARLRG